MRKFLEAVLYLFIAPGDIISDWLDIGQQQNRDLVRMLINGLFWIAIVVIGLAIWTSQMAEFQ